VPVRSVLFTAAVLTFLYSLGFLFVLTGQPVHQFTDILDLMRSAAMIAWPTWAVMWTGEKVVDEVQKLRLALFGQDIGLKPAIVGRKHGLSAVR
jgi:cytochrome c biogenesis protein CcdA